MKMKFSISKCSQVFNRGSPGYGGLVKFIIVDHYVGFSGEGWILVLLMVGFMQLTVQQTCIELMSDCNRLQSSGDWTVR
jgi:hypothetical protein